MMTAGTSKHFVDPRYSYLNRGRLRGLPRQCEPAAVDTTSGSRFLVRPRGRGATPVDGAVTLKAATNAGQCGSARGRQRDRRKSS